MPANYQKIVVDAAREAAQHQRELNMQNEARIIAGLKKAGMQVEQVDMAPFRAIVYEPVRKRFAEKNGMELLSAIDGEK